MDPLRLGSSGANTWQVWKLHAIHRWNGPICPHMTHNSMEEMFRVSETFTSLPICLRDPKFRSPMRAFTHFNQFEQLGMHHSLTWLKIIRALVLWMTDPTSHHSPAWERIPSGPCLRIPGWLMMTKHLEKVVGANLPKEPTRNPCGDTEGKPGWLLMSHVLSY